MASEYVIVNLGDETWWDGANWTEDEAAAKPYPSIKAALEDHSIPPAITEVRPRQPSRAEENKADPGYDGPPEENE